MTERISAEKEEIIIAATMHLCCVIPFIGMIAPLIVWLTKKDRSAFLSFHCLQSIIYQATGIIIFITGMILYILSFFVIFIATFISTGFNGGSEPGPLFFILFTIPFLIFFLLFFFFFAYVLYGIAGFIITLVKKDFKYIIIGNKVKKYITEETEKN